MTRPKKLYTKKLIKLKKDQEFNAQTRQKQGRYNKRLILKIVSDVESGHPWEELQDR
ncbi:MAG: hypothetical protein LKG19_14365 [Saprospiraceae bacterium]|jgi:hypothetical protein|nr:hypothetical protein [Saprospiraceae bacterium]MCI1267755.1 hypothetical protein [Saprospiraceae bacterium]